MNLPITEIHKITYNDYLKIDDNNNYEVINGELIMNPAPSSFHQNSSSNLLYFISDFVRKNNLGKIYHAPFDVILADNIILQPDLLFISKENLELVDDKGFFGSPDLVIEIISPSSLKRDIKDKREIYEKFKIKEYWLIFPQDKSIEVLFLNIDKYQVHDFTSLDSYSNDSKITSKLLDGLEISLKNIFD